MKISCKVIEDMLPIYYDGVCSNESAALVEEHLRDCTDCSKLFTEFRSEIMIQGNVVDDLKPLEEIREQWKKSKRSSMKKGILITLCGLLMISTLLVGIWYFGYGKYYFQMADKMERTPEEDLFFTSSDYTVEKDGYRFEVWMPIILSDSGFARVINDDGMVIFLYLEYGGDLAASVMLNYENDTYARVWLNDDLTPNFEDHDVPVRTDEQIQKITVALENKREELADIFRAIYDLWGLEFINHSA